MSESLWSHCEQIFIYSALKLIFTHLEWIVSGWTHVDGLFSLVLDELKNQTEKRRKFTH